MKNPLPTPAIVAIVVVLVIAVIGGGMYMFRDQTVALKPNSALRGQKPGRIPSNLSTTPTN